MSLKFFGQFLIDQGVVDSDQIRAALQLMDEENRSLGELAEAGGILTAEESAKVNAQQRYCDLPFGDLAVEMGLLSDEQVEYLVGDGLYGNTLAAAVLNLFPKLMVRVAHIGVRVGKGQAVSEIPDYPVRVAVSVTGDIGLLICLLGDEDFSLQLAGTAAGLEGARLEAARQNPVLLADGVGEFLNVVAGNAAGILEREKITTELEPPHSSPELDSGYVFDLAVGVGKAALFLKPL